MVNACRTLRYAGLLPGGAASRANGVKSEAVSCSASDGGLFAAGWAFWSFQARDARPVGTFTDSSCTDEDYKDLRL